MKKWWPWIISGLAAVWILSTLRPAPEKEFRIREFGQLPVMLNGRGQPWDSVARNSLLQLRHKQSVVVDSRQALTAMQWLLELMLRPEVAEERKVFRLDHPELISLLKLRESEKYFSFNQLKPMFGEIEKQAERMSKMESTQRTAFGRHVIKLYNGLGLFNRLKNSLRPETVNDFARELTLYQAALAPGIAAVRAQEAGKEFDQQAINRLAEFLNRYENFALMAHPFLVPPQHPETRREEWLNMGTALIELARGGALSPAVTHYATLATAFRQNKPAEFNRALAEYRQWLGQKFPRELGKGRLEFFYNDFQAFYKATVIYLLGFLLACASWFKFSEWLRRSAFYLIVLAWFLHTIGMVLRMILEGRPPVTNLYSSAVFIGWGAVALGLVLERFYRDGIGSVTAASVGLITQIIAHNLALGGDTMEVLRAVLDTNFWLATHVITITLGYSANFVAGFLATIYVLRGVLTRSLDKARAEALTGMVYGIICFATLFNFLGTVLGGIWADQSWGRFWGWDPKENGALIIVLWNAIILHARWGGMIHQRGLMNTAIFGNVVTAFSWFGVNMLGVGLHAYGFMDQAFPWLLAFVASQVVLIAIGLIPQSMWLSFRPLPIRPPPFPLEFKARRRPAIEGGD